MRENPRVRQINTGEDAILMCDGEGEDTSLNLLFNHHGTKETQGEFRQPADDPEPFLAARQLALNFPG